MKIRLMLLMILSTNIYAENSVILQGSHAKQILNQCSRLTPFAQSTWQPNKNHIVELEENLHKLSSLSAKDCCSESTLDLPPYRHYRQYAGIIINGKKYIYINAAKNNWGNHDKPIVICDGGKEYWGALYNISTKTFSHLSFNGDS